jgi:DNA polymerase I-like protein with 3'-5' exonuclease and polymerase domains
MTLAMHELVDRIPSRSRGPNTGLITQVHDALVLEVPASFAEEAARILESSMNRSYDCLPGVRLTASAQIGHSWDKV